MNYTNLIAFLLTFSHPDLNRSRCDTADRFDSFSEESEEFAILYHIFQNTLPRSTVSGYFSTVYNFRSLFLVPRIDFIEVEDDWDVFSQKTTENVSLTMDIAHSFFIFLENNFDNVNFALNPLNNFGVDGLQGVQADFSIELPISPC